VTSYRHLICAKVPQATGKTNHTRPTRQDQPDKTNQTILKRKGDARAAQGRGDLVTSGQGRTMAGPGVSRRTVLCTGLGAIGSARSFEARADAVADPDRDKLPQAGDLLVEAGVETGTTPLKPDDIGLQEVLFAWAFDPNRKIPRNGSRLNMVLLMRFDPATLGDADKANTADGVVAYSAICTHQQCPVTDWLRSVQMLQCPCHQSRYDPRQGAKVMGGPAPRPLPILPLRVTNGVLDIAAPFTDRVGGERQQGA
jgi:rieske iron-sulfur protein